MVVKNAARPVLAAAKPGGVNRNTKIILYSILQTALKVFCGFRH
jgi:hypothetical protein